MAVSVSRRAWRACGRPNSSRPFSKSGVSGEFRYFGSPWSMMRPPKAMISPFGLMIGIIRRSRKRS
jgi:hypothetical protein